MWRTYAGAGREVYSLNIRQWTQSIDLLNPPIFFLDMMVTSKRKMIMFGGVDDIENNILTSVCFKAIAKKNCWKPPYAGRGLSLLSHCRDVWESRTWGLFHHPHSPSVLCCKVVTSAKCVSLCQSEWWSLEVQITLLCQGRIPFIVWRVIITRKRKTDNMFPHRSNGG